MDLVRAAIVKPLHHSELTIFRWARHIKAVVVSEAVSTKWNQMRRQWMRFSQKVRVHLNDIQMPLSTQADKFLGLNSAAAQVLEELTVFKRKSQSLLGFINHGRSNRADEVSELETFDSLLDVFDTHS